MPSLDAAPKSSAPGSGVPPRLFGRVAKALAVGHATIAAGAGVALVRLTSSRLDAPVEPCLDWICIDMSWLLLTWLWALWAAALLAPTPALLLRRLSPIARIGVYLLGLLVAGALGSGFTALAGDHFSHTFEKLHAARAHDVIRGALTLEGWGVATDPEGNRTFVGAEVTPRIDGDLTFTASLDWQCSFPTPDRRAVRKGKRVKLRAYFECPQGRTPAVSLLSFAFPDPRGSSESHVHSSYSADSASVGMSRPDSELVQPLPSPVGP